MTPVLFVSHSSADRELAGRVVRLIAERTSCKPIIDQHDLEQGTEWRQQLYQWMAKCQAALLLLTDHAIESNWVLQEATILRARKALEPKFRAFVVTSPGLRERKPERWRLFEPLQLDELQGLRTEDEQQIADAVNAGLADMAGCETYFDRLTGLIADNLSSFREKVNALDTIAQEMHLGDDDWERLFGGDSRIVQLIARRLCRGNLSRYRNLRDFLQTLKGVGVPPEALKDLLESIAPYWVDLGAAACIPAAASAGGARVVAIRSSWLQAFTAARYLARHYRVYRREPIVLSLAGGNELAGLLDLRSQFIDAVRESNFAFAGKTEAEIVARVQRSAASAEQFVLLPEQDADDDAWALAGEFPQYVFIVPIRDATGRRQQWRRCHWVEPELSAGDEEERYFEFGAASDLLFPRVKASKGERV
jgi:hypothetical protein